MFIIDKYILRRCILPFLYCFISFIFLAVLVDLFEHGDDMIEKALPIKMLFIYYYYYIAATLPHLTPMAVLLATLYIISHFIRHNELTAMQSGGIHLARFLSPFILLALVISFGLVIVNETVSTKSAQKINEIKRKYLYFQETDNRYENLTKVGEGNRMYLIEKYHKQDNKMENLVILEFDATQSFLKSRLNARLCVWGHNQWIASQGTHAIYDPQGNIIDQEVFDTKVLNLVEKPSYFDRGKRDTAEMTYPELRNYIHKLEKCNYRVSEDKIELYNKIAIPLATFFVALLGIPCAFLAHGGVLINFTISLSIGLCYVILFSVTIAFGRAGFIPPLMASWFTNAVFGSTGLFLLFHKTK